MTTQLDVQGRRTILYLTNKSGGALALGDVVIVDAANDEACTTTTTAGLITSAIGVVIETNGIASNAQGRVCVEGYVSLINVNASVTRGYFGKTHTVAKQATSAGASRIAGVFCQFLTGGTTPTAVLFGMPDGSTGSAGSPGTPALTLSTTNATGAAATLVATDATIAAFDATVPVTQAFGDAAAAGSAGVAARRDHKHGMPVAPSIRGCAANKTTNTTYTAGGAGASLACNAEDFDTDAFHDTATNNSRITIPAGLGGKYRIDFTGMVTPVANGQLFATFKKNGTTTILAGAVDYKTGGDLSFNFGGIFTLVATDYIEVFLQAITQNVTLYGTGTYPMQFSATLVGV